MTVTLPEALHITSDAYVKGFVESLQEACQTVREEIGEERANIAYEKCIQNFICQLIECYHSRFISITRFRELVSIVQASAWKREMDDENLLQCENNETSKGKAKKPSDYSRYRLGCLLTPKDIDVLPSLAFSRRDFVAPASVDLRDYCVKTQNQEDLPWCAAYAACGFASNVLWRKSDLPQVIDPSEHYAYAKKIDGSPHTDGTTLVAVLQSLLHNKIFSSEHSEVKVLRQVDQVRYAIHKFGCCLVGLMVTREWYDCNNKKSTISGKMGTEFLGGHAVLACGYTRDGVIIQNSWGAEWGAYGFALITWDEFSREFSYGAVLDNCLYDTKMN